MTSVVRIRILVLLAFLVSAGLIWFAWTRMQENVNGLVQTVRESAMPDRNLHRIKELWIGFYATGTGVKSFSVTRDEQVLEDFLGTKDTLMAVLDTLRNEAIIRGDSVEIFNEISALLNQKAAIYQDLIDINYNKVLTTAIQKMGDVDFVVDTLIKDNDEGNFFQRMFSSQYSRKSMQARADSILADRSQRMEDYKRNVKLIREEEARLIAEESNREKALLNSDQYVTEQTGTLILKLENLESSRIANDAMNAEHQAEKAGKSIRDIVYGGLILFALLLLIIVIEFELSNKRRKQLAEAKKRAENLVAAKEEFMATMSHEIRTPLTSIIGFSNKLTDAQFSFDQKERYVKAIQGSSAHLLAVVNDVLDYSRIESGKLNFSSEPFRVDEVFMEVHDALSWKAEEKGVEFGLFVQPLSGVILLGDQVRLKQVIYNLAGNAIKFTNKGSVSISATIVNESNESVLIFKVSDTGIGIPPEKLKTVFKEFEQAGYSIEKSYGGTGLGLAISKRIVDQIRGDIEVESQAGLGSVFKVTMPFIIGDELRTKSSYTEDPEANPLNGKYILLVEDDPLICELVNHTLENYGAKVVIANDGNAAIEYFSKEPVDLILVDIQLPGLTGTEIITVIRNNFTGNKSNIPVIAMTANVMQHDIKQWLKDGMNDFITKPFRDKVLLDKICKLLNISIADNAQTFPDATEIVHEQPALTKKVEKLYDLKELIETSNGNNEFIRKMINLFLTSSFASMNNLKFHLKQKNWDQMGKTAHRMIGSYKHMGIYPVATLLRDLEALCSGEQELGKAAWLVSEIEKLSGDVTALLQEELRNY